MTTLTPIFLHGILLKNTFCVVQKHWQTDSLGLMTSQHKKGLSTSRISVNRRHFAFNIVHHSYLTLVTEMAAKCFLWNKVCNRLKMALNFIHPHKQTWLQEQSTYSYILSLPLGADWPFPCYHVRVIGVIVIFLALSGRKWNFRQTSNTGASAGSWDCFTYPALWLLQFLVISSILEATR